MDVEKGIENGIDNANANVVADEGVSSTATAMVVIAPAMPPATIPEEDEVAAPLAATASPVPAALSPRQANESPDSGKALIADGENSGNAPTKKSITTLELQPAQQQVQQIQQMGSFNGSNDKGKMSDDEPGHSNFKVLYVLTQLCGLTMIALMGSWIGVHMGGLGGTDNPAKEFYWHPLLMTIGLIYLYGNSILIYRAFRNIRKKTLKITHAALHMAAFILTVIALKTVFDSHNLAIKPIPNMYSLHSWLGLSAVIIFSLQYVAGFVAYLAPGLRESYRIALMPLHIYFGLFGFVLAIASALMGITEKAIFSIPGYSTLPRSGVMVNIVGVMYIFFGGLVMYMVTETSYKRKPVPEDTVLLTGANE